MNVDVLNRAGAAPQASTKLMIADGDISAALAPALNRSNIDLYAGIGGAPEAVEPLPVRLAAADIEKGKTLVILAQAIGETDDTGQVKVFFEHIEDIYLPLFEPAGELAG